MNAQSQIKPVVLIASDDDLNQCEIAQRISWTKRDAIILPALRREEVLEVVDVCRHSLNLAIVEERMRIVLPELSRLRIERPDLRILGCADDPAVRRTLLAAGCTETCRLNDRELFERIHSIVLEMTTRPALN